MRPPHPGRSLSDCGQSGLHLLLPPLQMQAAFRVELNVLKCVSDHESFVMIVSS